MKIAKTKLLQIIREEVIKLLNENRDPTYFIQKINMLKTQLESLADASSPDKILNIAAKLLWEELQYMEPGILELNSKDEELYNQFKTASEDLLEVLNTKLVISTEVGKDSGVRALRRYLKKVKEEHFLMSMTQPGQRLQYEPKSKLSYNKPSFLSRFVQEEKVVRKKPLKE